LIRFASPRQRRRCRSRGHPERRPDPAITPVCLLCQRSEPLGVCFQVSISRSSGQALGRQCHSSPMPSRHLNEPLMRAGITRRRTNVSEISTSHSVVEQPTAPAWVSWPPE
jgi:hypothetical protein